MRNLQLDLGLCLFVRMYSLPSPLSMLESPKLKLQYKSLIKSKVIDFWEQFYRNQAKLLEESSLRYFNPWYMSLARPHQLWTSCGSNPYEIHKAVIQAQMLSGRYPTDKLKRHWKKDSSGACSIQGCTSKDIGTIEHYLIWCPALSDARSRMISLCQKVASEDDELRRILDQFMDSHDEKFKVQFLLDCSQFSEIIQLKQCGKQVLVDRLFYVSRTWCYTIHQSRKKLSPRP